MVPLRSIMNEAAERYEFSSPFKNIKPLKVGRTDVDPNHAFYLGYEMAKAVTALTLGKDYRQDQALDWGYLTEMEIGCGPSEAAARVAGPDKKSHKTLE